MREIAIEEEHATLPVDEIMDLVFGVNEDKVPLGTPLSESEDHDLYSGDSDSDMTIE